MQTSKCTKDKLWPKSDAKSENCHELSTDDHVLTGAVMITTSVWLLAYRFLLRLSGIFPLNI